MIENQNVCSICGGHDNLCIDYNNDTKVIGLLCNKCKQGIGLFGDSAIKAAQYLLSRNRLGWDSYFMNLAVMVSSRSKDRSTKVGAVIVRDRVIISTGYNGFPRGINDDIEERNDRPLKYLFTCHAEENAVTNAARIGAMVAGSDMYVTLHPCTGCTKILIQSQIKRVFILVSSYDRWNDDFKISRELLSEAGIEVIKSDINI
jgi:dCMP deaminase